MNGWSTAGLAAGAHHGGGANTGCDTASTTAATCTTHTPLLSKSTCIPMSSKSRVCPLSLCLVQENQTASISSVAGQAGGRGDSDGGDRVGGREGSSIRNSSSDNDFSTWPSKNKFQQQPTASSHFSVILSAVCGEEERQQKELAGAHIGAGQSSRDVGILTTDISSNVREAINGHNGNYGAEQIQSSHAKLTTPRRGGNWFDSVPEIIEQNAPTNGQQTLCARRREDSALSNLARQMPVSPRGRRSLSPPRSVGRKKPEGNRTGPGRTETSRVGIGRSWDRREDTTTTGGSMRWTLPESFNVGGERSCTSNIGKDVVAADRSKNSSTCGGNSVDLRSSVKTSSSMSKKRERGGTRRQLQPRVEIERALRGLNVGEVVKKLMQLPEAAGKRKAHNNNEHSVIGETKAKIQPPKRRRPEAREASAASDGEPHQAVIFFDRVHNVFVISTMVVSPARACNMVLRC